MIKIIAIVLFVSIWIGLNRFKKIKYIDSKDEKINICKRYFFVPILGLLFGVTGAVLIVYYPDFDRNFDYLFIGFIFLYLLIDETISFKILRGKGDWFLSNNKESITNLSWGRATASN